MQNGAQGFCGPGKLAFITRPGLGLQLADESLQITRDWLEAGQAGRCIDLRSAQQPLATQQGPHASHPAAPGELGHDDRDEGDYPCQRHEDVEQVAFGFFAAPGDEAHVVHQHQFALGCGLADHGLDRHMQRSLWARQQVANGAFPALQIGTQDFRR